MITNIPIIKIATLWTCFAANATAQESPTFDALPDFYQVVSGQLNSLNPRTGAYTKIGNKIESYNAAGFNTQDNFVYAWGRYAPYKNKLIRIHGDGSYAILGEPTTTGALASTLSLYAGDMDNSGHLWIRGDKFKSGAMMKINVSTVTYEMVNFVGVNPGAVADIVYQKFDNNEYFFGARNQDLYVWDVTNLTVSKVPISNMPEGKRIFGAAYTDKDTNFYISDNKGGVYQILNYLTDSPRAVYLLDSQITGNNDGFSNPQEESPIIIPENQAPTIALESSNVQLNPNGSVSIGLDIDDEGLPIASKGLTIFWAQESGPGNISFSSSNTETSTLSFSKDGQYVASVTASDGSLEKKEKFYIKVEKGNAQNVETLAKEESQYSYARNQWSQVKKQLHCRNYGTLLEEEKRGFNTVDFEISEDSEVIVTAIYDGGDYKNELFWYNEGDPLTKTSIWSQFVVGPTAPLKVGSRASLGLITAGTKLRFGLKVDAGRGGQTYVFQNDALNPNGSTQIAARLFQDQANPPLIVAFEDWVNGDQDFNDVIFEVTIIPITQGVTQNDDVIDMQAGLYSDRGSRGVAAHLSLFDLANKENETLSQVFTLPEGNLTFTFEEDRSSMKFDFCVFPYDAVSGFDLGSLEFKVAAAISAVSILDDREYGPGNSITFNPSKYKLNGKKVGFMIVPNNKQYVYLRNPWRYTPRGEGNRTKRQPLFSIVDANPAKKDQFMSFSNGQTTMLCIEDHTRMTAGESDELGALSNSSFDDIIISITGGIKGADLHQTIPTIDPTLNWDGVDGIPQRDGANCY